MITFELNGQTITAPPGMTILAAARATDIFIPTLCQDDRLTPSGDCRLCSVEIKGLADPVSACTEIVRDGMIVTTESAALLGFRRQLLDWMSTHVSPDSFAQWPDKQLHSLMRRYGLAPGGPKRRRRRPDTSHPYIRVDMSQCIDCYRCVQICDEVQGQSVWHALARGGEVEIVPDSLSTLAESSCVGCGACVDTCPTGALTDRLSPPAAGPATWTRTTCGYCGVGCELDVGTDDARIVQIRPALSSATNKGHACLKGRYAFGFNASPDRITRPMQRVDGGWQEVDWEEANTFVATRLGEIIARYGPSAVGILGSSRGTNEDNYITQKFARVVAGNNNVDCCARVCHTPTAAAMKAMLGTGAATNSFDDIEAAATFLIAGCNPTENHPVVGARIKQQVARAGAHLIVIDPRRTELAQLASHHLQLRPGTDIPVLNALAHVIIEENLADKRFLEERVREVPAFADFIAAWTPERASAISGVPAELIREAARLYATARPGMCFHGLGITEHIQGTEDVMALTNLALLTGNLGRQGSGINPLRGQNNVQGAAQMGCDPAILTGAVAIEDRRALFEETWNVTIPRDRGLDILSMIDAAATGRLKALWVVGYDILPTLANVSVVRKALAKLDLIIVQDLFMTQTGAEVGHVFLPAASVFEKDGTFMNSERRIQRVRAVVPAPGDARPDWRIFCDIAAKMERADGFAFQSAQEIWDEVRQVWPEVAGISYARLESGGLQWPCLNADDPGLAVLHQTGFARSKTAALARIDYLPTPEVTDAQFPLLLTTGRTLYQFNAGTMTMRTANRKLRPTDTLDISPADATELGIGSGDRVRVTSRYGQVTLPARISAGIAPGTVFATFHDVRRQVNRLTGPHRDRIVRAPEYKVTAVAVTPVRRT